MSANEVVTNAGAFTLPEFCRAFRISTGRLYELMQAGLGPKTYRIGTRPYVSFEAAREWQRRMEQGAADGFRPLPARNPGRRGKAKEG